MGEDFLGVVVGLAGGGEVVFDIIKYLDKDNVRFEEFEYHGVGLVLRW